MSEVPQPTSPDLHEIFGMNGGGEGTQAEPVISIERTAVELAEPADFELEEAEPRVELDPVVAAGAREDPAPAAQSEEPPAQEGFAGITRPSRKGSSPGFLTDVIFTMGLATRR